MATLLKYVINIIIKRTVGEAKKKLACSRRSDSRARR